MRYAGVQPGVYTGALLLAVGGTESPRSRDLRVLDLDQPRTFGMPTAFCVMDGFLRAHYPNRFEEMTRRAHDLMLDYRLNPDDISRTEPPRIEDLLRERDNGMNRFNVLNLVPHPDRPVKWVCCAPLNAYTPDFYAALKTRLAPYVAELRKQGLQDKAYFYGFDERTNEYYPAIDALWKQLKADFPDIPVMTTAMMFRDMRDGRSYPCQNTTDWFCPLTGVYDPVLAEKLRSEGKQVWWYVCAGRRFPTRISLSRISVYRGAAAGLMTYLYRADGLLYWHVNLWPDAPALSADDVFLSDWRAENSLRMPGDGQLLYPGEDGPLPSIRLANIRDGIEDYEWLTLFEQRRGRAAAEGVVKEIVQSLTGFSRDADALQRARSRIGDLAEKR
jgi:glyoxylase-like metal-dependent hydrolase (beta-lactamase superfamily II)